MAIKNQKKRTNLKKSKTNKNNSLLSAIKETKSKEIRTEFKYIKMEDGRGRPPLSPDQLRFKIRSELTRMFIKIEKEAYKTFPESNGEVEVHVFRAIKKVIGI